MNRLRLISLIVSTGKEDSFNISLLLLQLGRDYVEEGIASK